MAFSLDLEKNREKIEEYQEFLNTQKGKPGNLMIALHKAQQKFGCVPSEIQQIISDTLRVPLSEIYGVITFYSQFTLVPKGKCHVGVCMGTACYVKGSKQILEQYEEMLGVKAGETSADGQYSLEATRCIGACGLAPVSSVNEDIYGHLTKDAVTASMKKYEEVSE